MNHAISNGKVLPDGSLVAGTVGDGYITYQRMEGSFGENRATSIVSPIDTSMDFKVIATTESNKASILNKYRTILWSYDTPSNPLNDES